jgi:hypothetical protein
MGAQSQWATSDEASGNTAVKHDRHLNHSLLWLETTIQRAEPWMKPAENRQVSAITMDNVVLRHFPWCRFSTRRVDAVEQNREIQFSAWITESDENR